MTGQSYASLERVIVDSMLSLPPHLSPFISSYLKPRKLVLMTEELGPHFYSEWYAVQPQYYDTMHDFYRHLMQFVESGRVSIKLFNRVYPLAAMLPDVCKWMNSKGCDLPTFTASRKFLDFSVTNMVPDDYYPNLAVCLEAESTRLKLVKVRNPQQIEELQREMEALTVLFRGSFEKLYPIARIVTSKTSLDSGMKVSPEDCFVYEGKPEPVRFFDKGGNAMTIGLLGFKGAGKTLATVRMINSAISQGFTVVMLGRDYRWESRFWSLPTTKRSNRNQWTSLGNQGEQPNGLPVTIYTDKPRYSIERSLSAFGGRAKDWNEMSGLVVFEDNIPEILKSFSEYRRGNLTKKFAIAINEAQELVSSVATDSKEWKLFQSVANTLMIHNRGWDTPTIMNTQLLSQLLPKARMHNSVFVSWINDPDDRKRIARHCAVKGLDGFIDKQELQESNMFYHVHNNRFRKVKFLVPPCMMATKYIPLDSLMTRRGDTPR